MDGLAIHDRTTLYLAFSPFEIRTVRLRLSPLHP
jgi:hypothetical protein